MSDSQEPGSDQKDTSAAAPRDEQAHRAALQGLRAQADLLGLLDALDAEPALIYAATGPAR